ncbi:MAG TPA: hypothetical protein VGR53_01805 [Nitrososphaerales archaeon]|nr:hypothetical protein [Nitrososphaerales archaeon]
MTSDDLAYRRSVRNMSLVLAAIVITVFAAIFVPPYVYPTHNVYQSSVSSDSPFGFTLHLRINSTSVPHAGAILLTGWVNSTSSSIENVTAANAWGLPQGKLWGRICTTGWPIGLGVMKGHYTQDNYTLGTVIPVPQPLASCPVQPSPPRYFLFEAHSSNALVTIGGNTVTWRIQTELSFSGFQISTQQSGVYTAVIADEWGDVLTTNFLVT